MGTPQFYLFYPHRSQLGFGVFSRCDDPHFAHLPYPETTERTRFTSRHRRQWQTKSRQVLVNGYDKQTGIRTGKQT